MYRRRVAEQADPGSAEVIWNRTAAQRRERPTRERVVAAAVELADAEGLDAVSIRRVAAALGTRPMGLYAVISSKEDLVDLMIDEVTGEAAVREVPGDWRAGLAEVARAIHRVCLAHPWLTEAAARRPRVGPNAIRLVDQSLRVISSLDADRATKLTVLRTLDLYATAHVHAHRSRPGGDNLADPAWRASAEGHLQRLAASGTYPALAEFGTQGLLPGTEQEDGEDRGFETGLDWLLAGMEVRLNPGG
jgi:AcrR family transcriptional regulator